MFLYRCIDRVEIFDENGKSYGVVLTEMDGHGIITPREPLPLGKNLCIVLQMVQVNT